MSVFDTFAVLDIKPNVVLMANKSFEKNHWINDDDDEEIDEKPVLCHSEIDIEDDFKLNWMVKYNREHLIGTDPIDLYMQFELITETPQVKQEPVEILLDDSCDSDSTHLDNICSNDDNQESLQEQRSTVIFNFSAIKENTLAMDKKVKPTSKEFNSSYEFFKREQRRREKIKEDIMKLKRNNLNKSIQDIVEPQSTRKNDIEENQFVQDDVKPQSIPKNDIEGNQSVQDDVKPQSTPKNDIEGNISIQDDLKPQSTSNNYTNTSVQDDVKLQSTPKNDIEGNISVQDDLKPQSTPKNYTNISVQDDVRHHIDGNVQENVKAQITDKNDTEKSKSVKEKVKPPSTHNNGVKENKSVKRDVKPHSTHKNDSHRSKSVRDNVKSKSNSSPKKENKTNSNGYSDVERKKNIRKNSQAGEEKDKVSNVTTKKTDYSYKNNRTIDDLIQSFKNTEPEVIQKSKKYISSSHHKNRKKSSGKSNYSTSYKKSNEKDNGKSNKSENSQYEGAKQNKTDNNCNSLDSIENILNAVAKNVKDIPENPANIPKVYSGGELLSQSSKSNVSLEVPKRKRSGEEPISLESCKSPKLSSTFSEPVEKLNKSDVSMEMKRKNTPVPEEVVETCTTPKLPSDSETSCESRNAKVSNEEGIAKRKCEDSHQHTIHKRIKTTPLKSQEIIQNIQNYIGEMQNYKKLIEELETTKSKHLNFAKDQFKEWIKKNGYNFVRQYQSFKNSCGGIDALEELNKILDIPKNEISLYLMLCDVKINNDIEVNCQSKNIFILPPPLVDLIKYVIEKHPDMIDFTKKRFEQSKAFLSPRLPNIKELDEFLYNEKIKQAVLLIEKSKSAEKIIENVSLSILDSLDKNSLFNINSEYSIIQESVNHLPISQSPVTSSSCVLNKSQNESSQSAIPQNVDIQYKSVSSSKPVQSSPKPQNSPQIVNDGIVSNNVCQLSSENAQEKGYSTKPNNVIQSLITHVNPNKTNFGTSVEPQVGATYFQTRDDSVNLSLPLLNPNAQIGVSTTQPIINPTHAQIRGNSVNNLLNPSNTQIWKGAPPSYAQPGISVSNPQHTQSRISSQSVGNATASNNLTQPMAPTFPFSYSHPAIGGGTEHRISLPHTNYELSVQKNQNSTLVKATDKTLQAEVYKTFMNHQQQQIVKQVGSYMQPSNPPQQYNVNNSLQSNSRQFYGTQMPQNISTTVNSQRTPKSLVNNPGNTPTSVQRYSNPSSLIEITIPDVEPRLNVRKDLEIPKEKTAINSRELTIGNFQNPNQYYSYQNHMGYNWHSTYNNNQ